MCAFVLQLAYQLVELQQLMKTKDVALEEQRDRLTEVESQRADVFGVQRQLQGRAEQVQQDNQALKKKYDLLLERQRWAETKLRDEKVKEAELLDKMSHLNERRFRAREADLHKELQTAARSKINFSSSFRALTWRSTAPKSPATEQGHTLVRCTRSASVTSPRILTSFKELFHRRRRSHSACSLEEDLWRPTTFCLSARVPVRALHVVEAHEQGINAARFSCGSALLATGGTDRVIKLWEVRAGSMMHRATLDGSTEGITCVDFDPKGLSVLAASYDKSAMLWRLYDSTPKLTLTGHSRKVTAARFSAPHQVVTGSADRTIRLWDLQRAACVQVAEAPSFCSDLVCADNCIISGHFDQKIRLWDTRAASCVQELPTQGRVTSLDISPDHRQLLSCCRDDCLQLADLRRRSSDCTYFRADGFKCGSDSTKAVISPDGGFLAAGSADGAVYIWNTSSGDLVTRLPDKHSSPICAVSWSSSGEYLVSVDKSRWAVLWSDM